MVNINVKQIEINVLGNLFLLLLECIDLNPLIPTDNTPATHLTNLQLLCTVFV